MATKKKALKKATKPVKKKAPAKKAVAKKVAPKKKTNPKAPKKTAAKKRAPKKRASKKSQKTSLLQNRWVRDGILAVVLILFGTGLIALTFQIWKPSSLAKWLPADNTVAYAEGDLTIWPVLEKYLTPEELEKDGVAFIESDQNFFENIHFTYRDYRWRVDAELPISETYLKKDSDFVKLRPNLPYDPDLFIYLKPEAFWSATAGQELKKLYPAAEIGWNFFENMLSSFPAMGIALNEEESNLIAQTYIVGDKSIMNGEALFHFEDKYEGELINYFPDTIKTYIGGQNLSSNFLQLVKLLNAVDGIGGWALFGGLQSQFEFYFGEELELSETLTPLFENEYALSYFPGKETMSWVFALQLTEETKEIAELLKETFVNRGLMQINDETATLSQIDLTLVQEESITIPFYSIQLEGKSDLLHYFIYEDVLFISLDHDETEVMVKALSNSGSGRLTVPSEIIQFADHIIVNEQLSTGVNLFDDGLSTLHFYK
ncbi:hypothetical protein HN748_02935 [Candidatus Peregrinibacteria bacterium]|jgi:hypothetical protein|nr:hypothetical protein [Candidatus Peregrinibacteria bacterium]MBT7703162.1 hypothetical protein [Candidatus Peregrinibacteria bacterium]